MPNVIGLSPDQAQMKIRRVSNAWQVKMFDPSGAPFEDTYDDLEFVVVATNPEPETILSMVDESIEISLSIDLSPETIAKIRKTVIDKEIQDSLENGFTSEDYYDGGSYIIFKAISSYPSGASSMTSEEFATLNQNTSDEYALLARANIVSLAYTSDGFLQGICISRYPETTDEEIDLLANQITRIITDADSYATSHINVIASSASQEVLSSWNGVDYLHNGDRLTFFVYSSYYDTGFISGEDASPKGHQEAEEFFRDYARALAQISRCNVDIKFYNKGAHEPFFIASSDGVPPWFPDL